ncbi:MAG: DegT/DnrJ/EryC1/StrS family aminotransferase [Candidatus Omnitrophota bacterium]
MRVSFGSIEIPPYSKKLIRDITESGRVTSGRYVKRLEEEFASVMGVREAVALSSGGDADALALAVLYDFGAGRGDEVIVPALSFVATGNAVLQAGFTPVFVDVERDTLNIDPAKIESAITKKTRAIMPVHLMGKPAKMDPINKIARRRGLVVIEDAAEAYGTEYRGRPAGTLGDMACFSLYAAHIITAIEGGMVVTDNAKYAEIIRSLRAHGRACKCKECVLNTKSAYCRKRFYYDTDIRFIFERIGYSSKMNELEAAVGLGQIRNYRAIIKKRRSNLLYLMKAFGQFEPYLATLHEERHEKIGPHAFAVIIREGSGIRRDEMVCYLEEKGIDTRSLFSSMPTQCPGFRFLGYRTGDFPNAEYIGNNGFHIGVHQGLDKRHLDHFIGCVKDFLKKRPK